MHWPCFKDVILHLLTSDDPSVIGGIFLIKSECESRLLCIVLIQKKGVYTEYKTRNQILNIVGKKDMIQTENNKTNMNLDNTLGTLGGPDE